MWNLPPIAAHLIELLLLLALSGIALGLGLRLLHLLSLSPILSLGERLLFGVALGYGALGFSMLAMGLLGVIYLPVSLVVLALLAAAGLRPLLREMRLAVPAMKRALASLRYPPNALPAAVLVLAIAVPLVKALVPVATQDDLMYHLALPRRYIEAHAITFYPDSTYSLFPQLMEMLYTWGLLLGSDRLSVLFAFSMGLVGPAAAALFARRYLILSETKDEGRRTDGESRRMQEVGAWRAMPLLVAAIFLTTPLIAYVLRAANTDLAQAGFDMLAVYAFILGVGGRGSGAGTESTQTSTRPPTPDPRPLLLSGICCGLSFSTKYYGFAMPVALGLALAVILLLRHIRQRRAGTASTAAKEVKVRDTRPITVAGRFRTWQSAPAFLLFYFALPVVDLAVPWLLRNIVASGNPVWPLAGSLLGGAYWSPDAAPDKLLGVAPPFSPANLWTGLEFLWTAHTRPPVTADNQEHAVNLGALLLPSLLTLLFARWQPAVRWLAYAAGAYWLIWAFFFSRTSARYLSTFFLLVSLLGAYGLVSMAVRYRPLRWAIGGIVGLALGALTWQGLLSTGPYLPTVFALDKEAERQYLQTYMPDYSMLEYIRDKTPPDATIYVWDGQPRGYYIPRKYIYARLVPLYTGFGDAPERWLARLGELGVTHILVHNRRILAPGQPLDYDPDAPEAQAFAGHYFGKELYRVGEYALYELR